MISDVATPHHTVTQAIVRFATRILQLFCYTIHLQICWKIRFCKTTSICCFRRCSMELALPFYYYVNPDNYHTANKYGKFLYSSFMITLARPFASILIYGHCKAQFLPVSKENGPPMPNFLLYMLTLYYTFMLYSKTRYL